MLLSYLWKKNQTNHNQKKPLETIINEHRLRKTGHRGKWHSVHMCKPTYMKFITVVKSVVIENYEDNEY